MSQTEIEQEAPKTTFKFGSMESVLVGLAICIWLLMVFTFSPPEDWKQGKYGTKSILPPGQIKFLKLGARLASLAILTFSLISLSRTKNAGLLIRRYMPMFLFVAWIVFSTFWSPLRSVSLQQAISFSVSVLMAFVVSLVWKDSRYTSVLFFNIVVAVAVLSAGMLVLSVAKPSLGVLTKNASGLFHSTTAGATASLGCLLALVSACVYRWRWSKIVVGPAVLLNFAVLVVAANRLSLFLTIVFTILILVLFLKKGELAKVSILFACCGLLYVIVDPGLKLTGSAVDKAEEYTMQGQSKTQFKSVSGRAEMWQKVWKSHQDSVWLGHGYFVTSEKGRIFVWDEWGNWTAHNTYLQVLVSTGRIGFFFYLVAVTTPFFRMVKRIVHSKRVQSVDGQLPQLIIVIGFWYAFWGILNASIVGPLQPESIIFAVIYGISMANFSDEPSD